MELTEMASRKLFRKLRFELYDFEILNDKCLSLHEEAQKSSFCAYVTFANEFSYYQCITKLQNTELLTYVLQDKKYKMDGQTVFIKVCKCVYLYMLFNTNIIISIYIYIFKLLLQSHYLTYIINYKSTNNFFLFFTPARNRARSHIHIIISIYIHINFCNHIIYI